MRALTCVSGRGKLVSQETVEAQLRHFPGQLPKVSDVASAWVLWSSDLDCSNLIGLYYYIHSV